MSVKCSGYARDPAKVEDQVRFLTWTLINNMACECDGVARQSSKLLDEVRFLGEPFEISNFELHPSNFHWRGTRTGTAAKLKPSRLRVRIPPASLTITWVDWTWESKLSVKQSLSMSNVGSIPSRPTDVNMARCDVGICSQPLKLAFTGSIPVRVTP